MYLSDITHFTAIKTQGKKYGMESRRAVRHKAINRRAKPYSMQIVVQLRQFYIFLIFLQ